MITKKTIGDRPACCITPELHGAMMCSQRSGGGVISLGGEDYVGRYDVLRNNVRLYPVQETVELSDVRDGEVNGVPVASEKDILNTSHLLNSLNRQDMSSRYRYMVTGILSMGSCYIALTKRMEVLTLATSDISPEHDDLVYPLADYVRLMKDLGNPKFLDELMFPPLDSREEENGTA